jgi:hypothetical protein
VIPSNINFGSTIVYDPSNPQTIRIRNNGNENVIIEEIYIGGADADDFAIVNLPNLPFTMLPLELITLDVVMTASDEGQRVGYISVEDDIGNGMRQITIVNLTGNAIDHSITIVDSMHIQNFDGEDVIRPNLPPGWNRLVETIGGRIITVNSGSPNTAPNQLELFNASDITNPLIASTPVIHDIDEMRVKFFARASTAGQTMTVGTISNPFDASTFQPIETITLTATHVQHIIPLGSATGTRIAFRHNNTVASRSIFIDTVIIEELPEGSEFQCLVSSLNFGRYMSGLSTQREVNISNLGRDVLTLDITTPENIFADIDSPINVGAGESVLITFSFAITATGAYNDTIFIETNCETTPEHQIIVTGTVMEAPEDGSIQIGWGTSATGTELPWNPWYRFTYSQSIYYPIEIQRNTGDLITSIFYHYNGHSNRTDDLRIYMGHTDLNAFTTSTSWIPLSQLTMVFDSSINLVATDDGYWFEISLSTPFTYDETRNLVIAINEHRDDAYVSGPRFFNEATPGVNRSIYTRRDSGGAYNPASPPSGTTHAFIPNTRLMIMDRPVAAGITVTPLDINFGDVVMLDPAAPRTVRVVNSGTEIVTIESIDIEGDHADDFTITGIAGVPIIFAPMESFTFTVHHTATGAGIRTATIVITDDIEDEDEEPDPTILRNGRGVTNVELTSNSTDYSISARYTQNFDALTRPALPIGWNVLNTATASDARIVTTTAGSPVSAPNQLEIFNHTSTTGVMILSTPIVHDIDQKWIQFSARASVTGQNLLLGTIQNPSDPNTFTLIQPIALSTTHEFFSIQMTAVDAPAGSRLAFRHPMGVTSLSIFIDDILIENIPDGAAFRCVTTNVDFGTFRQGQSRSVTVNVINLGTADLTIDHTLPNGVSVEPVGDIVIPPRADLNLIFTFNPSIDDVGNWTGQIVLETNAENVPEHIISATANVIPPPPPNTVQIGEGIIGITTSPRSVLPWDPWYRYSYTQVIYYPHEIQRNQGDNITRIFISL